VRTNLNSNPVTKMTPAPVVFNGTAVELPVNGNGSNNGNNGNNGKVEIKLLPTADEGVPTSSTVKPDSNDAATMV
jgi:hypothetical protein